MRQRTNVGGGAFLYDFMSLEGELSMTGTAKAVEPSRYFMTFTEERRDLFVAASLRFHKRFSKSRVFRMTVSDELANHYPGGVSGWTIRPGVMFRIDMPIS